MGDDYSQRRDAWLAKQKTAEHVEPWKPPPIKEPYHLYQHQVRMYNMATVLPGFAAFAEMGTGKTLTAIAVAGFRYQQGHIRKLLIVCPASVCATWRNEWAKYSTVPYHVELLIGTADQRKKALKRLNGAGALQIAVINYEYTWRWVDELIGWHADMIICDESQHIKSPTSNQSKALWTLGDNASYRMILTGTPVQNNTMDLWSQYRFLQPDIFPGSFYRFRARYAIMGGFQNHQIIGTRNNDELVQKTHSIAFRVRSDDCLDLPEETFENRPVQLDASALAAYRAMLEEGRAELEGGNVTAQIVITKLLRLRQITGGFLKADDGTTITIGNRNAKMEALLDIIDTAMQDGRKLVIFTQFTAEVDAITQAVSERVKPHRVVTIDGSVPIEKRGELIADFQSNDDCRVFVGQIDACSEGIELTAACTTVYYTLTYNYARYTQSLARTRRNGQKKNCLYIHLVAENTVDEKLLQALGRKEDIAKSIVDNWRKYFE